jgi:glutamate--cysteine ligase
VNALLQNKIIAQKPRIEEWILSLEKEVPLFMSADVRDAGFKVASIDANLYPAGFNNLHETFHPLAVQNLKAGLAAYGVQPATRILIISEEHTRNLFYLENIHVLKSLIEQAGYPADVATAFELESESYTDRQANLQTARGNIVSLLHPVAAQEKLSDYGALVMNHDSSAGTPPWIQQLTIPVLPAWQAGWHTRSKARHFAHYNLLMKQLGGIVGVDPWFFSPLDARITDTDINADTAREGIAAKAEILLKEIQAKYDEYQIQEKPFVFLKSDHGTYGMAMLSFDNAGEILDINRKEKNKLFKGKSSVVVKDYLLQEGVPTIVKDGSYYAESVIMLANNRFIGKFARVNEQKDARTSLNSTGMYFKPLPLAECENDETAVATIITRVAGIALQREVCELVTPHEPCFSDRPA